MEVVPTITPGTRGAGAGGGAQPQAAGQVSAPAPAPPSDPELPLHPVVELLVGEHLPEVLALTALPEACAYAWQGLPGLP